MFLGKISTASSGSALSHSLIISIKFIVIFRNLVRPLELVAASKRPSEAISSEKGSTGSVLI